MPLVVHGDYEGEGKIAYRQVKRLTERVGIWYNFAYGKAIGKISRNRAFDHHDLS